MIFDLTFAVLMGLAALLNALAAIIFLRRESYGTFGVCMASCLACGFASVFAVISLAFRP